MNFGLSREKKGLEIINKRADIVSGTEKGIAVGIEMYIESSGKSGPIDTLEIRDKGMLASYTDRPRLIRQGRARAEAKHPPPFA